MKSFFSLQAAGATKIFNASARGAVPDQRGLVLHERAPTTTAAGEPLPHPSRRRTQRRSLGRSAAALAPIPGWPTSSSGPLLPRPPRPQARSSDATTGTGALALPPSREVTTLTINTGSDGSYGLSLQRREKGDQREVTVLGVDAGSVNEGIALPGDEILTIGGVNVRGNHRLVMEQLVANKGKPVKVEVLRRPDVAAAAASSTKAISYGWQTIVS